MGGFFSKSLLHATKEHLQYFLWYVSALILSIYLFSRPALNSGSFSTNLEYFVQNMLLLPGIIIIEAYYLDLVDVRGCVCISIIRTHTSFL